MMKKENAASWGTIAASFAAASCCFGPALVAVFGTSFGFLGKLSVLDPLRPYLLGAATAMLGYSFWKLYLRPHCSCPEHVRARRIARVIFWTGFSSLIFAVSFRQMVPWILG